MSGSASNVAPYFLLTSTTNSHDLIDMPYYGESATSAVGTNRFYNKVDLIVVVSNSSITVKSGVPINQFTDSGDKLFKLVDNQWKFLECARGGHNQECHAGCGPTEKMECKRLQQFFQKLYARRSP